MGRNTAPAIALACFALNQDELVLISSSDHLIKNETAYKTAIHEAETLAKENNLVTLGITAEYPETGTGTSRLLAVMSKHFTKNQIKKLPPDT